MICPVAAHSITKISELPEIYESVSIKVCREQETTFYGKNIFSQSSVIPRTCRKQEFCLLKEQFGYLLPIVRTHNHRISRAILPSGHRLAITEHQYLCAWVLLCCVVLELPDTIHAIHSCCSLTRLHRCSYFCKIRAPLIKLVVHYAGQPQNKVYSCQWSTAKCSTDYSTAAAH